ncbi:MAG: zinc ABC transporter substrate-binding protein [Thermoproteota archaeon]
MDRKITAGIIVAAAVAAVALGIVAISGNSQNTGTAVSQEAGKVKVIASFYPLYDFARNVGGERADVQSLIPIGVEPHDWEPTPGDINRVRSADLFIMNGGGFEAPAIRKMESKFIVETSKSLELLPAQDDENDLGTDPHIWLDPVLVKKQVESIRDGLIQVDPANADYYRQNTVSYISELDSLDAFIRSELSGCEKTDFIAFHNAFTYFAKRYGLTQHSVQGSSPQGDVLPQRISEIKQLATELGIDVIYSEDLVDPRLANVIASEIPGGRVLVLSPIEGLDEEEQAKGFGYVEKMRQNVENLKVGLKCAQ